MGLCPVLFREFLPLSYSAFYGTIFYICICSGLNLSYVFGLPCFSKYFYFVISIPSVIEIIRIILTILLFNFQSPKVVFLKIFHKNPNALLLETSESTLQNQFLNNPNVLTLQKTFYLKSQSLNMYEQFAQQFQNKKTSTLIENTFLPIRLGFNKKYRKQFILAIILNFLNQATGVNVLAVYSSDVFRSLGFESTAEIITVVLGKINIRIMFVIWISSKSLGYSFFWKSLPFKFWNGFSSNRTSSCHWRNFT